ncbi:hypothetical protein ACTHQ4_10095 [Alkalicoccobacillus gibsonii]|uniref:hypothetical protein n=1 Tax=Alkalicoccobacillus gibsonii TaxID=79881 RepID=UPI003F7CD142
MNNKKGFNLLKFYTGIIVFTGVVATFLMEERALQSALEKVATINVTVAIGLSALSISVGTNREKRKILRHIVILLMFSLITFFVSVIPFPYMVQRVYLFLASTIVATLMYMVAEYLLNALERKEK